MLDRIFSFIQSRTPSHVVTTNTLMLLDAESDPELRAILENAALSIPESSGMRWAGYIKGKPFPVIIPGIDLMLMICERLNRGVILSKAKDLASNPRPMQDSSPSAQNDTFKIFLLGSAPGIAQQAAHRLQQKYPSLQIAGVRDGYFAPRQETSVLQHIRTCAPDVLFVGLGMPRQEKWIARHLKTLNVPVVMGIGGSFDVISGNLTRAPRWMQSLGIEWAYRFYQEPWRWPRMARLPVFLWKVLRQQAAQSVQRAAGNSHHD